MEVLGKVLALTVAGVAVIVLYLLGSVLGQFLGPNIVTTILIYAGLALTATWLCLVMFLASTGGTAEA